MRVRRLVLTVLLLFAFVAGGGFTQTMAVPATANQSEAAATSMDMPADMAMGGDSMAADCAMCAEGKSDNRLCLPACVGVQVILPEAPSVPIDVTTARLGLPAEERVDDPGIRPDPPRPRPSILS